MKESYKVRPSQSPWPRVMRGGGQPPGRNFHRAHGLEGGDLMIGARVAEGKIIAVIFFRVPLTAQPHEPDVSALMRVCDVHRIPLATNVGTADAIVAWLDKNSAHLAPRDDSSRGA